MKLNLINTTGKTSVNIEVSDKIFSLKPNKSLIKTVLDWQTSVLMNRKAKTKQRNEVRGSTAKIYAQKGTGGARHGSRKAPLFVGGGVAHGPKGIQFKNKKINKKVKKLGLINALSNKNHEKLLLIADDFRSKIKKTKEFNLFMKVNKIKNVLVVTDKDSRSNIEKSARNIKDLKLIYPENTNVFDLIKYKHVLFTKTSVKILEKRLINEKN